MPKIEAKDYRSRPLLVLSTSFAGRQSLSTSNAVHNEASRGCLGILRFRQHVQVIANICCRVGVILGDVSLQVDLA